MSPLRITKRSPLSKALGLDVSAGHKFKAERTTVGERKFDSRAEANHYVELTRRQQIGEIRNLRCQVSFVLMAPVIVGGLENINQGRFERVSPLGEYRADFDYEERRSSQWVRVVVDVKGHEVPLQRWKRIHAERQHGIEVQVVWVGRTRRRR